MSHRTIPGSRGIVTGASSGIGRAIAQELARQGARVLAVARRQERLAELGPGIEILAGDVCQPATRRMALDRVVQAFGGLDFLVNAAGISAVGPFAESSDERLRNIMELNFFAAADFIREAVPALRTGNRPIIVNVGSVVGHRAIPWHSEYCASKFALHGLSEAIRAEFSRIPIDVLVVSPGSTSTELYNNDANRALLKWSPSKGVTPEYVAIRTVRAMRRGSHEIIPNPAGKWLVWLSRLSPLLDFVLARYG